eukprot:TRINITY_DN18884_c0_g1_i1.p1 TRINITY_DN18884_c0_g1~~TRINITY_DN18884_c0_g1_i1.p1  ORF type:complete len:436 (-),score=92.16 TRINITY_DN18884_c0_g1_i1:323-1630(-)
MEATERPVSGGPSVGDNQAFAATGGLPPPAAAKPTLPANVAYNLPRYGQRGGGSMSVGDDEALKKLKEVLAAEKKKEEEEKDAKSLLRRNKSSTSAAQEEARLIQEHQEQRKRAEIHSKLQKWEEKRDKDNKAVMDRVEKGKDMRDERFKRLLASVTGKGNLAYKTALALREREAHEDSRRRDLFNSWEEKIYNRLESQADFHINPPSRAHQQKLLGSKSVDFSLPGEHESFRLVTNLADDPLKKQLVDHARETTFHHAANAVINHTHSAPVLLGLPAAPVARAPWPSPALGNISGGRPGGQGSGVIPASTTRPVLEPTKWGQVQIQGSPFGHFAQACEYGPGFKRAVRGGNSAHLPDMTDGVEPFGTRRSRVYGHNDVGILKGTFAAEGEARNFKTNYGASNGAPNQDHFTYETGTHVTNLEFPLGKRMFPQFH